MQFDWHGEAIFARVTMAAQAAVRKCALDLQQLATDEAPVDTGDLRGSCSTYLIQNDGAMYMLRVGFDRPYAIIQHERLDFNHPRGGKAKYLEDPFNANKGVYAAFVEEKVMQAIRG